MRPAAGERERDKMRPAAGSRRLTRCCTCDAGAAPLGYDDDDRHDTGDNCDHDNSYDVGL